MDMHAEVTSSEDGLFKAMKSHSRDLDNWKQLSEEDNMYTHVNVLSLLASFNLFNNPRNKIGKWWYLFTTTHHKRKQQ